MFGVRRALTRCAGAASAGAAAFAFSLSGSDSVRAASGAASGTSRTVHELSFTVPTELTGDFSYWLKSHLKQVLQLPGMQGAKLLSPIAHVPKPGVVFVLGGPGAGKGTQCGLIVENLGYTHLSAGDLLRAERKSGSAQGQMIDEYIKEGKIVPVEVTVKLLLDAIRKDGGQRFLVDGFPRNTNNLSGWQQVTDGELQVGGVLFYDCPEEIMQERLLERGKTSGRTDDNLESIKKRFDTYTRETAPIIEYYKHQELVHKIDGTREVDTVWLDSQAAIEAIEARFAASAKPSIQVSRRCLTASPPLGRSHTA